MAKSAIFLLVVGFALGLWIGFNPQLHKQAVTSWDHTRAFFANLQTQVSSASHGISFQSNVKVQSNPQTQSSPQAQSKSGPGMQTVNVMWRQVSSILATLWNSLQHLWLQIRASLGLKKL